MGIAPADIGTTKPIGAQHARGERDGEEAVARGPPEILCKLPVRRAGERWMTDSTERGSSRQG